MSHTTNRFSAAAPTLDTCATKMRQRVRLQSAQRGAFSLDLLLVLLLIVTVLMMGFTFYMLDSGVASGSQPAVAGLPVNAMLGYVLGGLALLLLLALAFRQGSSSQGSSGAGEQQRREIEDQNRRNQEAILRLLDELGDLAEGDLTVQASVTEDITGAIADSVNYAIEALRDLGSTINSTSEQIASAAQDVLFAFCMIRKSIARYVLSVFRHP